MRHKVLRVLAIASLLVTFTTAGAAPAFAGAGSCPPDHPCFPGPLSPGQCVYKETTGGFLVAIGIQPGVRPRDFVTFVTPHPPADCTLSTPPPPPP